MHVSLQDILYQINTNMDKYLSEIRKELNKLSNKEMLLFGAITCEQLYQNYVDFQKKINWGNSQTIREAIDAIYQHIIHDSLDVSNDIPSLMDQVELNTPGRDTHPGVKAYLATDACTAVLSCLEYIITSDPDCIVAVATYARDTVGMLIRIRDGLESSLPVTEPEIDQHELMLDEKQRQLKLIRAISETDISKVTHASIENLRDKFLIPNINGI